MLAINTNDAIVARARIELAASWVWIMRYNQLSYLAIFVGMVGTAPTTSKLSVSRSNYLSYTPICEVTDFHGTYHPRGGNSMPEYQEIKLWR